MFDGLRRLECGIRELDDWLPNGERSSLSTLYMGPSVRVKTDTLIHNARRGCRKRLSATNTKSADQTSLTSGSVRRHRGSDTKLIQLCRQTTRVTGTQACCIENMLAFFQPNRSLAEANQKTRVVPDATR